MVVEVLLPAAEPAAPALPLAPMPDCAPVPEVAPVALPVVPVALLLAPMLPLVLVVVSELVLEPYPSELLRVPLLQPATPSERAAMAAATVNVIFFVFIG